MAEFLDNNYTISELSNKVKIVLEFLWDLFVALCFFAYFWLEAIYHYIIPATPKSLNGEIILITGSASGIGQEICWQLAKANFGATLICWDVQTTRNEETVEKLEKLGAKAYGYTVDISDAGAVKRAAEQVRRDVGDVTVVINNAGIMACEKFLTIPDRDIERTFQINVISHFWIIREFLPKMLERNHGHIVSVASACGIFPSQNLVAYSSSKAAAIMYMEALRQELRFTHPRKSQIHLTTVYPIGCNTPMLNGLSCSTRFDSICDPLLTPEIVAEKVIDGLRRNYQNVYIPFYSILGDCFIRCIPSKVLTVGCRFTECVVKPQRTNS